MSEETPRDILSVIKSRMIELPEIKTTPAAVPSSEVSSLQSPLIAERDFISDTYINNNRFIKNFRDRYNIIHRSYQNFYNDHDYIVVDSKIKYIPRNISSTEELVLSSFMYELDRLLTKIITLRNSDKLLPKHLTNLTNQQELDSLILDIQTLTKTIQADIDNNYRSHCIVA